MTQHTKGPWTVEHDEMHSRIYGADPALIVAAVHQQRRVGISEEQRKANAHLIAAAPELLAALEQARDAIWNNVGYVQALQAATDAIHLAKHGAA